jgi:hypothetical protein
MFTTQVHRWVEEPSRPYSLGIFNPNISSHLLHQTRYSSLFALLVPPSCTCDSCHPLSSHDTASDCTLTPTLCVSSHPRRRHATDLFDFALSLLLAPRAWHARLYLLRSLGQPHSGHRESSRHARAGSPLLVRGCKYKILPSFTSSSQLNSSSPSLSLLLSSI